MARRWRWPPETLVPPWVMKESSCSGLASTKSRLRDPERPRPRRRWRPGCRSARCGDGAREQERLGHEPDEPLEELLVEVADVDPDQHLTGGDVEQRATTLSRAVFPEPVLPMTARRLAASTRKLIAQHGLLGARERDSAWRARATPPGSSVIPSTGATTEVEVRSTSSMRPAHTEARRTHHEDPGAHHDGHQDLDEVAEEGDERTDLHLTGVDASAPNHTGDARDVDGEQHRGNMTPSSGRSERGLGEVGVGGAEAGLRRLARRRGRACR